MMTQAPFKTTTPMTTVETPTTEESVTPPSKDLAEMYVLTDVELHQAPYHPDYADPSSFMYKSMESTVISTVISKIILLRELFIKKYSYWFNVILAIIRNC